MNQELIQFILDFVKIQEQLIKNFHRIYDDQIADWEYLLDCPNNGYFSLFGENWKFEKHGKGICFIGQKSGKVIDAHKGILSDSQVLDAWRLIEYFESIHRIDFAELIDQDGNNIIKQAQKNLQELISYL